MNKTCEACKFLGSPENEIANTQYWKVVIGNNHAYLGRAYVQLKTHKGSLSKLSQEEWTDFEELVRTLEKAYADAFGAAPLNWACLMNHAFQQKPFNPHVHWHVYPRYEVAPEVAGIKFTDELFGYMYDSKTERIVAQSVVDEIAAKLREHIK